MCIYLFIIYVFFYFDQNCIGLPFLIVDINYKLWTNSWIICTVMSINVFYYIVMIFAVQLIVWKIISNYVVFLALVKEGRCQGSTEHSSANTWNGKKISKPSCFRLKERRVNQRKNETCLCAHMCQLIASYRIKRYWRSVCTARCVSVSLAWRENASHSIASCFNETKGSSLLATSTVDFSRKRKKRQKSSFTRLSFVLGLLELWRWR